MARKEKILDKVEKIMTTKKRKRFKGARKFGKKKFFHYLAVTKGGKGNADGVAEELRKRGYLARVTPYKYGYDVWRRKK